MSDEAPHPLGKWGTPLELSVRRRIALSVAAYAYEIANDPVMPDAMFDWMAQIVCPRMGTCHPLLDEFFATKFSAMTGMWIHDHPELDKVAALYERSGAAMRSYYSDPANWPRIQQRNPA